MSRNHWKNLPKKFEAISKWVYEKFYGEIPGKIPEGICEGVFERISWGIWEIISEVITAGNDSLKKSFSRDLFPEKNTKQLLGDFHKKSLKAKLLKISMKISKEESLEEFRNCFLRKSMKVFQLLSLKKF